MDVTDDQIDARVIRLFNMNLYSSHTSRIGHALWLEDYLLDDGSSTPLVVSHSQKHRHPDKRVLGRSCTVCGQITR